MLIWQDMGLKLLVAIFQSTEPDCLRLQLMQKVGLKNGETGV